MIFAPLLILTMDVLGLPADIYENWVNRAYGLSVQGWGSWAWDWTKSEFLSVIMGIILIYILYAVIRKSPRRWWFYFWLASLPLGLALVFIEPLVIDPDVPQVRAARGEGSRADGVARKPGAAGGPKYSAGANFLDGSLGEIDGTGCVRHRIRRVEANRGVGHHH